MSKLDTTLEMIRDKTFVSIREIQRSPSKALDGFKIILNNGKMQWVYIPQDELDEYVEDLQAMGSEKYKAMIKASRASGTVSAEEVWKHLWLA